MKKRFTESKNNNNENHGSAFWIVLISTLALFVSFFVFALFFWNKYVYIGLMIGSFILAIKKRKLWGIFFVVLLAGSALFIKREQTLRAENYLLDIVEKDTLKKENVLQASFFLTNEKGWMITNSEFNDNENEVEKTGRINSEGFRSKELQISSCPPDRLRVLFLGDSFTWGHAKHPTSSFVDSVEKGGYCTYNTGVPCADLPQYLSIAREMLPRLKPDFVCLMFCEQNDFIWNEREVSADKPIGWVTNHGIFPSENPNCKKERFMNLEESKDFYFGQRDFLMQDNAMGKFFRHTKLWSGFMLLMYQLSQPWCLSVSAGGDVMVTKSYLDRIKKISEKEGSRFLLFIIPDKENIETDVEKFKKRHGEIFESFEVLIPQVSLQDYETGNDMHLNVKGHGVFANYILATLK